MPEQAKAADTHRKEVRIGAANGVGIFKNIFLPSLALFVSIFASKEELPGTWSIGYQ